MPAADVVDSFIAGVLALGFEQIDAPLTGATLVRLVQGAIDRDVIPR